MPTSKAFPACATWPERPDASRLAGGPGAIVEVRLVGALRADAPSTSLARQVLKDLSQRVEWVASTRGDGVGYDIASFEGHGGPRLIEVKTTGLGREFPFYVTANELSVSREKSAQFWLYRVFEFAANPRVYALNGALDRVCRLEPQVFMARVSAER